MKKNSFYTLISEILIVFFHIFVLIIVFLVLKSSITRLEQIIIIRVILVLWLILILFCIVTRVSITIFVSELEEDLDNIMDETLYTNKTQYEDSLYSKITHKLEKISEINMYNKKSVEKEKLELQRLISDISHQVKNPISNLKIFNQTLLDRKLDSTQQKEFLELMNGQIGKLDFLMQSMIKISRLENNIIVLNMLKSSIYDTIGNALNGILLDAERKEINIIVQCNHNLEVMHDAKWTSEALFNIIDNAVKYTACGGTIKLGVEQLESYTRITICDNGIGIKEENFSKIFMRFYRENRGDSSGVGIGLYLAREIISKQGGSIQVKSKINHGSTFLVMLQN